MTHSSSAPFELELLSDIFMSFDESLQKFAGLFKLLLRLTDTNVANVAFRKRLTTFQQVGNTTSLTTYFFEALQNLVHIGGHRLDLHCKTK